MENLEAGTNLEIGLIVVGVCMLVAAVFTYLKNTAKAAFPIVLTLGGIFLCGAQTVSASLPGGGEINFRRTIQDASTTNTDALLAQESAIAALQGNLELLSKDLATFKKSSNERFVELAQRPIPTTEEDKKEKDKAAKDLDAKVKQAEGFKRALESSKSKLDSLRF